MQSLTAYRQGIAMLLRQRENKVFVSLLSGVCAKFKNINSKLIFMDIIYAQQKNIGSNLYSAPSFYKPSGFG